MGFANNSIPLGQVDTDLFICPVALEASVHTLILGNSSDTPVSVNIKRYDHSLGQTFTLIPNIAVVKGSPWHLPAPLNLVSGDKLIAVASDEGVVASGDGFISGAPDAITFNMRGPWNSSHTYKKFDVASYQGRSFVFWSPDESTTTPPLESGQWVLLTDHAPIFFDGTIPSPNGVAATGTSDAVARADHVHPAQTAANTPVTSASQGVETVQQAIDDLVATKADASHTHDVSEITGLGSAALEDTSAFASAGQGALADTAVQPNTDPVFSSVTIDNNTQSHLFFQRDGKNRWMVGTDGSDEPGDNTGGNFGIARYDDSGAFLGYSMAFLRQYPNAFFWSPPVVPNYATDALPPAGIQGGLAFDATTLRPAYDNGTSWVHLLTSHEAGDFATAAQGELADTAVQPDDLEAYAPLADPAFTGVPTAPKPDADDDSSQIATTGWVTDRIEAIIDGAPAALDTLKEIADKLDDNDDAIGAIIAAIADKADADHTHTVSEISGLGTAATKAATDFATAAQGVLAETAVQPGDLAAVATSGAYADLSGRPTLGTAATANVGAFATAAQGAKADTAVQPGDLTAYAPLASPAFTGVPTGPTPTSDDDSQRLATTAWVKARFGDVGGAGAPTVVSKTGDYVITTADTNKLFELTGAASRTFTLPSLASVGTGWSVIIRNSGDDTAEAADPAALTITATGSDTILGLSSIKEYRGGALVLFPGNGKWSAFRIGNGKARFTRTGPFTWPILVTNLDADLVSGGSGGSRANGSGGNGGGRWHGSIVAKPSGTIETVTVGAGGAGATVFNGKGLDGGNTIFSERTVLGATFDSGGGLFATPADSTYAGLPFAPGYAGAYRVMVIDGLGNCAEWGGASGGGTSRTEVNGPGWATVGGSSLFGAGGGGGGQHPSGRNDGKAGGKHGSITAGGGGAMGANGASRLDECGDGGGGGSNSHNPNVPLNGGNGGIPGGGGGGPGSHEGIYGKGGNGGRGEVRITYH